MNPANHETELTDAYLDALQAQIDADTRGTEVPRVVPGAIETEAEREARAEREAEWEAERLALEQRSAELAKESAERQKHYEAFQAERKAKLEELKRKVEAATSGGRKVALEVVDDIHTVFGEQKTDEALKEIGWMLFESDLHSDAYGPHLFTTAEFKAQLAKDEAEMAAKEKPKKASIAGGKKSKRPPYFKPARRVPRSSEGWRVLKNYPGYEISTYGRVRSLERLKPDDFLKPRFRWFKGAFTITVRLYRDKVACDRSLGMLMVDAGFLNLGQMGQKAGGGR
jgi:hypothetical protein